MSTVLFDQGNCSLGLCSNDSDRIISFKNVNSVNENVVIIHFNSISLNWHDTHAIREKIVYILTATKQVELSNKNECSAIWQWNIVGS